MAGGNEHAARELVLYIENDVDIYRQRTVPIIENLRKKAIKGTFDYVKSYKLWMNLVEDGAKRYTAEFAPGDKWNRLFDTATRQLAAIDLAEGYAEDVMEGMSENPREVKIVRGKHNVASIKNNDPNIEDRVMLNIAKDIDNSYFILTDTGEDCGPHFDTVLEAEEAIYDLWGKSPEWDLQYE